MKFSDFKDGKATDYIPIEGMENYNFKYIKELLGDDFAVFQHKTFYPFGQDTRKLPSKIGDQDTFTCDGCLKGQLCHWFPYPTITAEVYKIEYALNPEGKKPGNYFRRDWRKV
ncbi:MAG: hypothetical protein KAS30_01675 [Candidatus Diapherotrites archaeon]|nr:hypothetical protein [Candidatus Diapherotrites archaeon]